MTMAGDTIGFEIIRSLREEEMFLGLLSGTAHPGLRVRDQVIEVDGPGFRKGQQAELNRGRIAPGIRHQVCALDFCAIHFRQAVHCLSEKLGRSVLDLVPRSEEHTSELQSHSDLVCRLLLEKKKKKNDRNRRP